jgi:hypothetical protein
MGVMEPYQPFQELLKHTQAVVVEAVALTIHILAEAVALVAEALVVLVVAAQVLMDLPELQILVVVEAVEQMIKVEVTVALV